MALLGAGTVVYVMTTSGAAVPVATQVVLGAAVLTAVAVLLAAAAQAGGVTRALNRRVGALRSSTARGQAELQRLLDALNNGERPALRGAEYVPADAGDVFALLENDLNQAQLATQAAVVRASTMTPAGRSGQQVEVFVNLARRLQSLVHREIQLLDELENEVEDPDLLKGLFYVDHLATRMRRHAENLAVLGGAVSRRQWSRPVAVTEVLRSAIAEVEQYSRVKLVPPIEGTLRGHAVADVIHLLAELVENATNFSPPHTNVLLRAQSVTSGLAVEVEDRGLGMSFADQDRVNNLLADPDRVDIGELLRDGRIGLFVVSALGRRHGLAVRLQANIYGGTQAVVILPHGLLGGEPEHEARQQVAAQQVIQAPPPQQPVPALAAHATAAIPAEAPTTPGYGHSSGPTQVVRPVMREPSPAPVVSVPTTPTSDPGAGGASYGAANHGGVNHGGASYGAANHGGVNHGAANHGGVNHGGVNHGGASMGAASMSGASMSGASHGAASPSDRPQLPQRHRQTHLVPQLHQAPAPRPEEPVAGHDPNLMASFMRGVSLADSGADDEDGHHGRTDGIS
ncbi:ATP-binding protein [Planosporangium mesophilum]|nr:ATP-binding protein [Planosporangium mesophilum]